MKKSLAIAIALIMSTTPLASAQNTVSIEETFDSIFAALMMPKNSWAKWEAVEKIKGVNWQWPLNQRSQHNYSMKGTGRGNMEVEISGCGYHADDPEPPCLGAVSITFAYGQNFPDAEEPIYIDHLSESDQLTKISTTCDSDELMDQFAFYQWIKPGYEPLYIYYAHSFGSRMGTIDYNIGYVPDDILYSYSRTCEAFW